MRALIALLLSLWLAPAWAQLPMTGAGKGTPGVAASYQGPGDIKTGAVAFYSCARVYDLSKASTSTNLCDLVAVTGGAAVCTLRGSSTGFVDLAGTYCSGTDPASACAAASGGSCVVSKVYNQIGGTNCVGSTDCSLLQSTHANRPALTFNSLNSLPCMTFDGSNDALTASAALSATAQPFNFITLAKRTGNFTSFQIPFGSSDVVADIIWSSSANNIEIRSSSAITPTSATDNLWHSLIGVFNGASSIFTVDGSSRTGLNPGSTGATAALLMGGSSHLMTGPVCEAGAWQGSAWTTTDTGDIYNNQHGSNGYGTSWP